MSNRTIPFLIISGPPGVGKTTVAWEVFDQLIARGSKHALLELCRPGRFRAVRATERVGA